MSIAMSNSAAAPTDYFTYQHFLETFRFSPKQPETQTHGDSKVYFLQRYILRTYFPCTSNHTRCYFSSILTPFRLFTSFLSHDACSTNANSIFHAAIKNYCDGKLTKNPKTGLYFRTCEDGAGWHLIPYRISPRSEFFSQAYKTWHIT